MTATAPRRVAVVGAGMVGLATAWFLQEHGVEVTVLDRHGVAAGASWGNAGWVTPGEATPLPSPAILRYGLRAVVSPASPVYVPLRPDTTLLRFLGRFTRSCTPARWGAAMRALVPLNVAALPAFDRLAEGGVTAAVVSPEAHLACFRTEAERRGAAEELTEIRGYGQPIDWDLLDGAEARALNPLVTEQTGAAIALRGQRYLDPGRFVAALAEAVQARGGSLRTGVPVTSVSDRGDHVRLVLPDGEDAAFDAVVVATGTWLPAVLRPHGVRLPVQAGRGYSFSVPVARAVPTPLYFPVPRVACTPWRGRLRVAGMMELRPAEAPLDPRRIRALVDAARPLLADVDLDDRQDEWVGSRPATPDGLPLVGPTRSPRIWSAGGHGMWGVTLGPVTGHLVADSLVRGSLAAALRPLDPLR